MALKGWDYILVLMVLGIIGLAFFKIIAITLGNIIVLIIILKMISITNDIQNIKEKVGLIEPPFWKRKK